MNLVSITERFKCAVEVMELRWTILQAHRDRFEPRLLARYIRSLRRCHRIRETLRDMVVDSVTL